MSVEPLSGAPDHLSVSVAELSAADWKTRWQAAQTLGELKDDRAVGPLLGALDDSNQWVRIVAAEALGQIGDRGSTQALIFALQDDSMWVRRAGVVALGQIGDAEAIPPLMNRLLDPPNNEWPEELRDAIAKALGKIGAPAIQTLIYALDDPDPWVSSAAAKALGQIRDPEAVDPLTELTKTKHAWVRSAATQALAQIADSRAVRAALTTDQAPRAFWKLMALREIDQSTIAQLKALLDDPDERIRSQAAEVLNQLTNNGGNERLATALRSASGSAAAGASFERERLPGTPNERPPDSVGQPTTEPFDSVGPLVAALNDPVAEVRLAAAEALGKIGRSNVIPVLSQAMHDDDSRVRAAAARAIGGIGAKGTA